MTIKIRLSHQDITTAKGGGFLRKNKDIAVKYCDYNKETFIKDSYDLIDDSLFE